MLSVHPALKVIQEIEAAVDGILSSEQLTGLFSVILKTRAWRKLSKC
jgi:hypothetical protein